MDFPTSCLMSGKVSWIIRLVSSARPSPLNIYKEKKKHAHNVISKLVTFNRKYSQEYWFSNTTTVVPLTVNVWRHNHGQISQNIFIHMRVNKWQRFYIWIWIWKLTRTLWSEAAMLNFLSSSMTPNTTNALPVTLLPNRYLQTQKNVKLNDQCSF